MYAEYRKTTRPAPMRTSPMMIIVPRRPRLRFGPIAPADTFETSPGPQGGIRRRRIKGILEREGHASLGPAPRFEVVADPHALHLRVLPYRLEAHLPPDAAHLHPAERRGRIDELVRVDPHHPGSELRGEPVGASQVLRPEARAEAVRNPVRDGDRFVLLGEWRHRDERPKDLLLADPHRGVLGPHEGRKHVVAAGRLRGIGPSPAIEDLGALALRDVHVLEDAFLMVLRGERPHLGLLVQRVADAKGPDAR